MAADHAGPQLDQETGPAVGGADQSWVPKKSKSPGFEDQHKYEKKH